MIINGSSRSNGAFFGKHLMRADHNERVEVVEIRGLAATSVPDAFREMKAIAQGTRATNYFYHANLNTRESEVLTREQWVQAVDQLERELGLTDQPRFVVEHEKEGRTHRHVVWSRIDADSMTAISDSLTYAKHERAARQIEQEFGLEPVKSVLVKDRETPRPERNPQDWESLRAQDSKLDPKAIKAEVTSLWLAADSGVAFAAALAEHGYILVRGDRRDLCLIDRAGDEHSLARRIAQVKAADIRTRMGDIDPASLPSVAEGRALARQKLDAAGGTTAAEPDVDDRRDDPQSPELIAEEGRGAGPAQDAVARDERATSSTTQNAATPGPTMDQREEPAPDGARPAGTITPTDAAAAEAQLRAVAAQFPITELAINGGSAPILSSRSAAPTPSWPAANAAEALDQLRSVAVPFVHAILRSGMLVEILAERLADGLDFIGRAADRLEMLIEDVRETFQSWRGTMHRDREVDNRDDGLDFD